MANRTVIVDNNTWNNTHIATVGRAMASHEEQAWQIYRSLDVNYVFVVFGGFIGCGSGWRTEQPPAVLWCCCDGSVEQRAAVEYPCSTSCSCCGRSHILPGGRHPCSAAPSPARLMGSPHARSYPSDDINKFLWMVRIGGGVFPDIKEKDFLGEGGYRVDDKGGKVGPELW